MKKLIIILTALLAFGGASAQNNTKGDVYASISPVKMNVFYVGLNNPIEIAVSGYNPEDLKVNISSGTISKDGSNPSIYNVAVRHNGISTITVTVTEDGKEKVLVKRDFRLRRISDPVPEINGLKGGTISKEVLANSTISVYLSGDYDGLDTIFTISEFSVSSIVNGYLVTKECISSNKLNQSQIQLINDVETGSMIFIHGIKALGIDGSVRLLNSMQFIIID